MVGRPGSPLVAVGAGVCPAGRPAHLSHPDAVPLRRSRRTLHLPRPRLAAPLHRLHAHVGRARPVGEPAVAAAGRRVPGRARAVAQRAGQRAHSGLGAGVRGARPADDARPVGEPARAAAGRPPSRPHAPPHAGPASQPPRRPPPGPAAVHAHPPRPERQRAGRGADGGAGGGASAATARAARQPAGGRGAARLRRAAAARVPRPRRQRAGAASGRLLRARADHRAGRTAGRAAPLGGPARAACRPQPPAPPLALRAQDDVDPRATRPLR